MLFRANFFKANLFKDDDTPEELAAKATATAAAAAAAAAAKKTAEGVGDGSRRYTQDEVNRMVKADKDKAKKERDQYLQDLEALKAQGLTPENLDSLNARIETLQNEGKTKDQLAAEERGKLEKKLNGEITKRDGETKLWRGKYETYRSQTEILTAAAAAKAHNPTQVYQILRPDTFMVEETGADGKPTGEFVPRVKFKDADDKGQPVTLDLTVADAIKRMTEMEIHQNLFDSGGSSGLGGRNNGRTGGTGNTAIPTDTKSFMEARKKNPNLLRTGGTKA